MFQSLKLILSSISWINVWAEKISFNSSYLYFFGLEKKISTDAVMKCLEQTNNISNSKTIRNADGLLLEGKKTCRWTGLPRISQGFQHVNLKCLANFAESAFGLTEKSSALNSKKQKRSILIFLISQFFVKDLIRSLKATSILSIKWDIF